MMLAFAIEIRRQPLAFAAAAITLFADADTPPSPAIFAAIIDAADTPRYAIAAADIDADLLLRRYSYMPPYADADACRRRDFAAFSLICFAVEPPAFV